MKTKWKCEDVEPRLTALGLGELPTADAAAINEHLSACARCRELSQEISATLGLVRIALADAPAGAAHLDAARRARTMQIPRRDWRASFRDFLDLPKDGPIAWSLWPGAMAKAAVIFLIPLTIALGLFIPGFRAAWRDAMEKDHVASSHDAAQPEEQSGYIVNVIPESTFAERDLLVMTATGETAQVDSNGIASRSGFDAAAEHWNGESLVRNEMPKGNKLGLGMSPERQALDLANATAPAWSDGPTKGHEFHAPAVTSAPSQMVRREKSDGKLHLTTTMAARPPAPTNNPVFSQPPSNRERRAESRGPSAK